MAHVAKRVLSLRTLAFLAWNRFCQASTTFLIATFMSILRIIAIFWRKAKASSSPLLDLSPSFLKSTYKFHFVWRLPKPLDIRWWMMKNLFSHHLSDEGSPSKRIWHLFPLKNQYSSFTWVPNWYSWEKSAMFSSILLLKQSNWKAIRLQLDDRKLLESKNIWVKRVNRAFESCL